VSGVGGEDELIDDIRDFDKFYYLNAEKLTRGERAVTMDKAKGGGKGRSFFTRHSTLGTRQPDTRPSTHDTKRRLLLCR
jgi:hypothetical protein